MANRPRFTRWDAVWASGAVALVILWGIVAKAPFYDLIRIVFLIGLAVLGVTDWRAQGHRWIPTMSWTAPFTLWMVAFHSFVDRSSVVGPIAYFVGVAFAVSMMASTRMARWWYKVVLRRPYKA
jgi:hypothetical protein